MTSRQSFFSVFSGAGRQGLCVLILVMLALSMDAQRLPTAQLAKQYFGADAAWYQANIPFFEIDDPELQQIYYYRWELFHAHLRDIGPQRYMVTEFLPDVPWARHPYTDLNDSSSFHLLEARWLRDPRYATSLLDHLYSGAGNTRAFSESVAAAAYAVTQVTGDPAPAVRHLDAMQYVYNAWDDHFDRTRNLYWVEPLADATEYTISSIDASGAGFTDTPSKDQNHNGFTLGFAFRPSINAYQYGNARAIAALARQTGQPQIAKDYDARADRLQQAVLKQLWNPQLQHFTDIYQRTTPTVVAGTFVRGRELVGYVPWQFDLATPLQAEAWRHALNPAELAGPHGLRTVEPTYPKYMTQYRYEGSAPECQWNGPSWPFQTSQTLTGLANYLHSDKPTAATATDYLRLLRQYAHQHYLTPGHPDLEEDYNPDTGAVIVGLARSHHYSHSTFNDLILSGLVGLRPNASDRLDIQPLIDDSVDYFAVEDLQYHGHTLAIYYDRDNTRYHLGHGLTIFVDGKKGTTLPPPVTSSLPEFPLNLAANPGLPELAQASASSSLPGAPPEQAIDGRLWFFPQIANGWSPVPGAVSSTFELLLPKSELIKTLELSFFTDGKSWLLPTDYKLEAQLAGGWVTIPAQAPLVAGTPARIPIPVTATNHLRLTFTKPTGPANFRLIELKVFGP